MKEVMQGFHMTPIAEIFLGKKALLNHMSPSNYAAPCSVFLFCDKYEIPEVHRYQRVFFPEIIDLFPKICRWEWERPRTEWPREIGQN